MVFMAGRRDRPETITKCLDDVLSAEPGRLAVLGPSGALSYGQLDAEADAAAEALAQLGVGRGDRVAACLPNDLDMVVAFHGAMRLGAVWVGVNRNLAPAEQGGLLDAATPAAFLAPPAVAETHAGRHRSVAVEPGGEWADALAACRGAGRRDAPDPGLPAGIAFTSGTTGEPKGIVHSQHNLLLPAAALAEARGYDETLRKGDCLPLTVLNLQVLTTLLTSRAGGVCLLTDRRDARGVAEWIGRDGVTVWNGVPAIFYDLVRDESIDPSLLAPLREAWTGGAPCPEDLFHAVRERFGVTLHQTYGLTEAPTVATIEPLGGPHVPGGAGTPLPHLEVVIRDEGGQAAAAGEIGEIVVRARSDGPWAGRWRPMVGLWQDNRLRPYDGDELATGDLGTLDADGNLSVRDRKKLLIVRGGANVYPAEVERVIEQLPTVKASAVIGLPDDRLGQRVVAVVEAAPGATVEPDAVVGHCAALLARYKVPEQVVVVDVLPRNAMGKVSRPPLGALFAGA